LGIIVGPNTFATHGDVLVVVDEDTYAIGDVLVPSSTGLCRKATRDELIVMMLNAIPRPRITAILPGKEFVCAFLV
jgi:hypothetical protein